MRTLVESKPSPGLATGSPLLSSISAFCYSPLRGIPARLARSQFRLMASEALPCWRLFELVVLPSSSLRQSDVSSLEWYWMHCVECLLKINGKMLVKNQEKLELSTFGMKISFFGSLKAQKNRLPSVGKTRKLLLGVAIDCMDDPSLRRSCREIFFFLF